MGLNGKPRNTLRKLLDLKIVVFLTFGFFASFLLAGASSETAYAEDFNIEITSAVKEYGVDAIDVRYKLNNGAEQAIRLGKLSAEPGYAGRLGISGSARLAADIKNDRSVYFTVNSANASDKITINGSASTYFTLVTKPISAQTCYSLNKKTYANGTDAVQNKCIEAGYCISGEALARGQRLLNCSSEVYLKSDAYKLVREISNSEAVRAAQTGALIKAICDTIPSGVQFDDAREGCANQVRDQYSKCITVSGDASMGSTGTRPTLTSCMQSWAKTNYPKANVEDIEKAIKTGQTNAENEIERQRVEAKIRADEQACKRKGDKFAWNKDTKTCEASASKPEAVCAGGALGWVLCPIVQLASGAVIELTKLIDGYMRFDPLLGTPQGDAVYNVWRIVVNIANLLLVVAFLVVIFSQATSFGLSAYGIKKMLPRIILSAILINISFYLCAILVDIFNVVGASIAGIVGSVIEAIPDDNTAVTRMGSGDFFWSSFLTWAVTVGSAALVMTFGGGLMAVLLPIIITVAASLFMLFAILALRHSIALLLIMISPLAFAAMILPNTDGLFKKWWKALYTVLFLYPLIMLLSYGSLLVSKIMLTTIPANEVNTLAGSMGILIALLTSVAWIFALKFIVTWGSGLVGKVAGMVNDKTKGIVDRPKNWAKERGKQVKNDRRNQRMEWLQEGKAPLGFRGLQKLGRKFDPAMLKARRDGWSGVYEEQGKLAAARNSAEAIKNSPRADATQRARAQATLDELDIKRAKVKLDFEFEGNAQKAFDKALEVGDNALLKLSAGKLVDNAKLESVQQKMAENMDENQIVSLSRHLMNNHFAKVKEQDLGMMYALQELAGEVPEGDRNYATSKEGIKKLRRGGSEFDKKAMTASNVAIGSQEKYVLNRQTGTGAEYSNIPPVMEQKRALEIASDPNTRGSLKAGQLEILEQHATRPLPPP